MRRPASIGLALLYGGIAAHIYSIYPLDRQIILFLFIFPLTSIVLLILSFRVVSVDEAVRIRLTSNLKAYKSALGQKVILSNDGFSALVRMLLGTNFVAAILILWNQRSQSTFSAKVSAPLAYLFGIGSVLVCLMCILMSFTQPIMKVTFDDANEKGKGYPSEIPDALPPIKVLAPYLSKCAGVEGWHKVGSTSRRHDIHAKVDQEKGVYEIRTIWAADHPSAVGNASGTSASQAMKGKLADL